jgi:hypothetical protein
MYNTLQAIISPKYIQWYWDFEEICLVDDKKGLHIMDFIFKTRGQKKYDGYLSADASAAQMMTKKFDMKGCEAMMRKKETTTRYTQDFAMGGLQTSVKPKTNIFVFKNVSQLEHHEFLQSKVAMFLDSWIALNDELKWQELVLKALRALNSRFRAHQVPTSEQRDQFNAKKKDWALSKPIRLDNINVSSKLTKTDYNAEFKQKIKGDWELMKQIDQAEREEERMAN